VVITSAGAIAVRAGTAATAPTPAARVANDVVLAVVYVPAADTAIQANKIVDLRVTSSYHAQVTGLSADTTLTLAQSGERFKLSGVGKVITLPTPIGNTNANYMLWGSDSNTQTISPAASTFMMPDGTTPTSYTVTANQGIEVVSDGSVYQVIKLFGKEVSQTPNTADNSTKVATTAMVQAAITQSQPVVATTAEMQAGTVNTVKGMSPLLVKQAIDASSSYQPLAAQLTTLAGMPSARATALASSYLLTATVETDLNNISEPGVYNVLGTTNSPLNGYWVFLEVFQYIANPVYLMQRCSAMGDSVPQQAKSFLRYRYVGSTWSAWHQVSGLEATTAEMQAGTETTIKGMSPLLVKQAIDASGANVAITGGSIDGTPIGSTTPAAVAATTLSATATIATGGYTVATLPAGVQGQRAYVTDATAPTFLGALTGGGTVKCPVFRNATTWVSA
jgi:hypothetical protein